jgi:hypothetical protein
VEISRRIEVVKKASTFLFIIKHYYNEKEDTVGGVCSTCGRD